jgi:WD40 repeat protein
MVRFSSYLLLTCLMLSLSLSGTLLADGKYILSGGDKGTLKLWDLMTGSIIKSYAGHDNEINSVAYSPNGKYGATGSSDRTVKVWDINTTTCLATLTEHEGYVLAVAFSPDGTFLASGSGDNTIKLWDTTSWTCTKTLSGFDYSIFSLSISPDSKYILAGGYYTDYSFKLWDVAAGTCLNTFLGHTETVTSVAYSPDGKRALSGSNDMTLKLWNMENYTCISTFSGHTDAITSVAYSPDGRYGLSGGYDKTVKLWEMPSGTCLKTFVGHTYWVTGVAFSPDGKYAASCSPDNHIMIWELSTGNCVETLRGQSDFINAMAFNSKNMLLTSPNGGEVWECESQRNITWLSSPWIETLNINYSLDNGLSWTGLVTGANALKGYFTWTLPSTPSTKCLVEIQDANSQLSDRSDAVFTIKPGIRVVTPNGGEEWPVDSLRTISWVAAGFDTLIVGYSTDAGINWKVITRCPTTTKSYEWTIPDEPSDQCLVKISNTIGDLTDVSDAYFTIYRVVGFADNKTSQYKPYVFSVSPNPFKERLRITLPSEASVYSLTGNLIMKLDKGVHTIDTAKWGNGVYIVKCSDEVKRVVKIR